MLICKNPLTGAWLTGEQGQQVWEVLTDTEVDRLLKLGKHVLANDRDMFYAEVGYRYVCQPPPMCFDDWRWCGDTLWEFDWCVIDDFGNLVPVSPFNCHHDDYVQYVAPDSGGKYVLHTQHCH